MSSQITEEGTSSLVLAISFLLVCLIPAAMYMFSLKRGRGGSSAESLTGSRANISCSSSSQRDFSPIVDQYKTLPEVQKALRSAGLESSDLIIGIDFTKSNTWQGEKTFRNRCLHEVDDKGRDLNPYQKVITAMGRCLEEFDDDNLIPAFGFGDAESRDKTLTTLNPKGPCKGFEEVLLQYCETLKRVKLSGPTSFRALIDTSANIAKNQKKFHILLIIADGQVTNKTDSIEAIVRASRAPLSIIMVGVGDGPWGMMREFDDEIPSRSFDNFQFVDFNKSFVGKTEEERVAHFAMHCLMEVPEQFKLIRKLGLLSQ